MQPKQANQEKRHTWMDRSREYIEKYFSKFKKLWSTQKRLKELYEADNFDLWFEILSYYAPRTGKIHKAVNWKDIAFKVHSEYIRLTKSKNGKCTCVTCWLIDRWYNQQNGHYRTRSHLMTAFLDENCYPQCYRCNVVLSGNYRSYAIFMIDKHGKVYEEWIRNNKEQRKIKNYEYQSMILEWYKHIMYHKSLLD